MDLNVNNDSNNNTQNEEEKKKRRKRKKHVYSTVISIRPDLRSQLWRSALIQEIKQGAGATAIIGKRQDGFTATTASPLQQSNGTSTPTRQQSNDTSTPTCQRSNDTSTQSLQLAIDAVTPQSVVGLSDSAHDLLFSPDLLRRRTYHPDGDAQDASKLLPRVTWGRRRIFSCLKRRGEVVGAERVSKERKGKLINLVVSLLACGLIAAVFALSLLDLTQPSYTFVAVAVVSVILGLWRASYMDRTLTRLCLSQFNSIYLLLNVALLVSMGAWSEVASGAHWSYVVGMWVSVASGSVAIVLLDATPSWSKGAVCFKLASLVLSLILLLRILIVDQAIRAEFADLSAYLTFAVTSRRLALSACWQLVVFNVKYLVQLSWMLWSGERFFVSIFLPTIATSSRVAPPSFASSASSSASSSSSSLPSPNDEFTRFISVQSVDLVSFVTEAGAEVVAKSASTTAARTYQQSPVVPWTFFARLTTFRAYPVIMLLFGLGLVLFFVFLTPSLFFVSLIFLALGAVFYMAELSRFDRALLFSVISRFDFWLLLGSLVQYSIFAMIAQDNADISPWYLSLWNFLIPLLFLGTIFAADAAPSYPLRLRFCILLLIVLNACSLYIANDVNNFATAWNLPSVPVCFYICADARFLALSAMFTVFIFFFKYLIMSLIYPSRCMILVTGIQFTKMLSADLPKSSRPRTFSQ